MCVIVLGFSFKLSCFLLLHKSLFNSTATRVLYHVDIMLILCNNKLYILVVIYMYICIRYMYTVYICHIHIHIHVYMYMYIIYVYVYVNVNGYVYLYHIMYIHISLGSQDGAIKERYDHSIILPWCTFCILPFFFCSCNGDSL